MNILLIDDEPLALEMLKDSVAEACPDAVLHPFLKTSEALAFLHENPVDIAFLDIQMRGMTGLEMAVKCKQLYPKINLIFATGYDSYAIEAMTMHASGYIMKPITAEKVRKELMNLRHPLTNRPGAKLRVKCFGNFDVTLPDGTTRHYDGYRLTSRGAKGVMTIAMTDKVGRLVAVKAVSVDDDLLVVTKKGVIIRTPLSEVKIAGRNTQGVKIINVEDRDSVASLAILPHVDPSEEEEIEEETPVDETLIEENPATPDSIE